MIPTFTLLLCRKDYRAFTLLLCRSVFGFTCIYCFFILSPFMLTRDSLHKDSFSHFTLLVFTSQDKTLFHTSHYSFTLLPTLSTRLFFTPYSFPVFLKTSMTCFRTLFPRLEGRHLRIPRLATLLPRFLLSLQTTILR